MDPAQGSSGLSLRLTATFADVPPQRGRLAAPNWTFQTRPVHDSGWADDLATFCHKHMPGGKLGLVVEDCSYRSLIIARSIGQAIGAVRFGLHSMNLLDASEDPLKCVPAHWRKWSMPAVAAKGRQELKEAARETVRALYGLDDKSKDADVAEATLLLDYACCEKGKWYRG